MLTSSRIAATNNSLLLRRQPTRLAVQVLHQQLQRVFLIAG